MQPKSVSLIVTTYNWPSALELVLLSIKKQSHLPNEVIIADDGSSIETTKLIEQYQTDFPVPLIHSWQEDIGFRLSRSRNLAISKSASEYIIMIDGDMILHQHFVRDHQRTAKPNYFTQGRRVILAQPLSDQLIKNKNIEINLLSKGVENKLNAISCAFLSPLATALLSKKDHRSVRGCNMAYWRKDILQINGYNEQFTGWGREDSEFVVRLLNSGCKRQDLRFGGVAYHLYHKENSRTRIDDNDRLLEQIIQQKSQFCESGLNLHLNENSQGVKDD